MDKRNKCFFIYLLFLDAEAMYRDQEKLLMDLSDNIEDLNKRMGTYLVNINKKSDSYRNCLN